MRAAFFARARFGSSVNGPLPSSSGVAPATPATNYPSSPSSQAGRIDHVVTAPAVKLDASSISTAITYKTYRGTDYFQVLVGPDGPLTPTSGSSTTYTATGVSAGSYFAMTTATVDGIEGPGQVIPYTVT